MNPKTLEALETMEKRINKIDLDLQDENITSDIKKLTELNKERSTLEDVVAKFQEYKKALVAIKEAKEIFNIEKDQEMIELAKMDLQENEEIIEKLVPEIEQMLIPKDPNDDKNVIIEIRGAAGGDEGNIFAGDLFKMYKLYCEKAGWKMNIMEASISEAGGYSQIVFMVKGDGVYSKLKFESGAHRVQRVPKTEAKGRIQTSTATVAVLPEMSDVEINIKPIDLRIDTYRSSGAGGQHVNTTDSAVRITHLPTGIVASSQDGRSQLDNKETAMKMLRAKVYEAEVEKQQSVADATRKNAVGTGARSEKIRTYNYPQNRVTDHRVNLSLNKLDQVMEGNIDEFIISLINHHQLEQVAQRLEEEAN
ncbi:peptide chain release factor 1 [Williamsoniiplasma luminosum]|uniref:Peptide chain release factor 1 n=1 Tax=Williamsoniiplasma luminosum TaxID=214888 RepID=A0A2K8NT60_9MOLU|nr:peptide chain release factor 1 [Williamsoniiplasma luminosum]ATZ16969.1 peptide chain release factor 1 [Williamsoniiplasma luminosum]AVP49638.1 MAG: peptide chain release factor 1 [Williamsoniiplasma luminosum]